MTTCLSPLTCGPPPLSGPWWSVVSQQGQTGELGRLCREVHSPHQCKGSKERVALSADLHCRKEKEAGVSHQEGGMRPEGIRMSLRVTRANLLCCQGCTGQVLDWDGWRLFALPSLRQMVGWWDHLWAGDPHARWQLPRVGPILPPHRQQGWKSERTLQ